MRLIKENALLLSKHVNDLLDIAKFDAAKLEINYYDIDFVQLIKKVLSLFEADIEAKEFQVSCDFPKTLLIQIDSEK